MSFVRRMAHGMSRSPQPRHSPLDEPETADYAWARYFRLMRYMGLVTALVMVASAVYLYQAVGFVSIHFYIATMLVLKFKSAFPGRVSSAAVYPASSSSPVVDTYAP